LETESEEERERRGVRGRTEKKVDGKGEKEIGQGESKMKENTRNCYYYQHQNEAGLNINESAEHSMSERAMSASHRILRRCQGVTGTAGLYAQCAASILGPER
jgi:hypothetical protein